MAKMQSGSSIASTAGCGMQRGTVAKKNGMADDVAKVKAGEVARHGVNLWKEAQGL